jgi:hypothetical protein
MKGKLASAVILSWFVFTPAACDDDEPSLLREDGGIIDTDGGTADVPATFGTGSGIAAIGVSGGVVTSLDERVAVHIPRDALAAVTLISITVVPDPAPGALGAAYDVSPGNLRLAKPVRVVFKFGPEDLGEGKPTDLRAAIFTAERWMELDRAGLDVGSTTVSGEAQTLGRFALVPGFCQVCSTTCNPATCRFGAGPDSPGVAGKCVAYGQGCSRCVPMCDGDGDGFCPGRPGNDQPGGDCRDNDPTAYPGAREVCGNMLDDDCDGHIDEGCTPCTTDADCTAGFQACMSGICEICEGGCKPESCVFGGDENTPGVQGRCHSFGMGCSRCVPACDKDGDGFCPGEPGSSQPGGDCDDNNPAVHPKAVEVCGNGLDDDCNGDVDEGCAPCAEASECPRDGQTCQAGACVGCENSCSPATCRFRANDMDPGVAGRCVSFGRGCSKCVPLCDGDGDGYCPGSPGNGQPGGDCRDNDPNVHPMAVEICGNGFDDNCNGYIDEGCTPCTTDEECSQGLMACIEGVCDICKSGCDPERCRFGVQPDMPQSGVAGRCHAFGRGCSRCVPACDKDGDGFCPGDPGSDQPGGDCDDANPNIHPMAPEICGNMIDDNCDGRTDEACATCATAMVCGMQESCTNGR